MPSPFVEKRAVRLTVIERIMRRGSLDAAVVAINNLFAKSGIRAVTVGDLDAVFGRFNVASTDRRARHVEQFYRDYLIFCLADRRLSDGELADLEHLREILCLDEETVDTIHRNVARQIYLRSVSEVLADGTIDAREREFLAALRDQLGVPELIADNIEEMKARQYRSRQRG
jgi:hypothetical protein